MVHRRQKLIVITLSNIFKHLGGITKWEAPTGATQSK